MPNDPRLQTWLDDLRYRLGTVMYRLGTSEREKLRAEIGTWGPPRSSPGEPPHADTGALMEGVSYDVEDDLEREVRLRVTSAREGEDPAVPTLLEYGGDRNAPRPYMRPAFDALRGAALRFVADALREESE